MKCLSKIALIGILLSALLLPTKVIARKLVCVEGVPHYQICVAGHWPQHPGARGHCFLKPVYYYYRESHVCHYRSYHPHRHIPHHRRLPPHYR